MCTVHWALGTTATVEMGNGDVGQEEGGDEGKYLSDSGLKCFLKCGVIEPKEPCKLTRHICLKRTVSRDSRPLFGKIT